ncbi:ABC transporter permease [Caproicibacter fermentans]|uniref:ABC transporter permease n=1 Tax=Caproicibacter fermentans TaxID=2576756 RepID=A0A7G8TC58_9FIRM|nr:ABC transporter permease [Caproicibacter fermentans]QNK41199.1 ABC transporter permease [Caproicibacter fermentans]
MKPNVFLKSLTRQPFRALLLFLLTGLISFAAVSQVTEYLLIREKTNALGTYYHTIGSLQTGNKDGNVFKGAGLVSKSPYVVLEDRRRYCSGVLQGGLYNADADGAMSDKNEVDDNKGPVKEVQLGIHVSDVIAYAKLLFKVHVSPETGNKNSAEEYYLTFRVNKVVAGYPEYVEEDKTIKLSYVPKKAGEVNTTFDSLKEGKEYLIRAYFDPWRNPIVASWNKNAGDWLTWKPLTDSGLWVLPVEPGKTVDFNIPELKEFKNDLDVLRENQHAMDVRGTKDMSTMPDTQESAKQLYLVQGRWLDREDDLKANRVCVVNSSFAKLRGLSVGSSITLKMRDLKQNAWGYIIAGDDWKSWKTEKTYLETFKIVGLYGFLSENYPLTIYTNALYIPDSCLPAGYGETKNELYFSNYSFVLKSYRDKDAFLAEDRNKLAAMGMTVTFMDNGSANFWSSADSLKFSTLLSAVVFCVVLLLAFGLSVFLYLRPRRKEFAIQRALGKPCRSAAFQMAWPFILLGIVGIFLGGAIGWNYAFKAASKSLAGLQTTASAAVAPASLPIGWMFLLCSCILVLLVFFTWIGTFSVSRRPVLELLQGTSRGGTGNRKSRKLRH